MDVARAALVGVAVAALCGCADTGGFTPGEDAAVVDSTPDVDTTSPDIDVPDAWVPPDGFQLGEAVVYAHSQDTLYKVDPDTLSVTKVADFVWPAAADKLTDLAIDSKGLMIGVSSKTVYRIDAKSGQCTALASLDKHYVGLSFVKPDGGEAEFLIGIDKTAGEVYRIDPQTGKATLVGKFGGDWLASGDIVSVKGFGTVATLVKANAKNPTDWLASVNPYTGVATPIGDTGVDRIWGLGYWKGKLYGFTSENEFVLIDRTTGKATLVSTDNISWWGAGVTTTAPVIN